MAVATKPAIRKAVARPRAAAARPPLPVARHARLAGVGTEAVKRATGKGWDEWLQVLDRAGAKTLPHKEIALLLSRRCGVPDWWCQMVTVGYEQARGLRAVHQHADGFAANCSRTVSVEVGTLFAAWNDARQRARWLPKAPVEVRRATEAKSIRLCWTTGGSRVEVNFFAKGARKSQVQVEHARLPSAAAVARQKAYWSAALDRLKELLEG